MITPATITTATITTATITPGRPASVGTPIQWPFWTWWVLEFIFGLVGFLAVFVSPEDTATNFAWTIEPPVMAGLLGACDLATGVMLLGALSARHWEDVRAAVVAAGAVTSLMLLNTMLHWDAFTVGVNPPFALWLVSYLIPPPLLAALFWWQQRRAVPMGARPAEPLPSWFRTMCLVTGGAFVVVESLLYVFPALLVGLGPWAFTPLTVRTLAGWLIGLGLALLMIAWDNDWRRARIAALLPLSLGPAIAFQLVRFADQVDWTNVWLTIDLVVLTMLSVSTAWMWLSRTSIRRLARLATIGAASFLGVLLIMPALRPDLDVLARWVAEFARGPLGWIMTVGYVALALAVFALARGLAAVGGFGRTGPVLLAVAGVGAVVAAILPQDPSDPGTVPTVVGTIRQIVLVPVFLSLFAALLLLSRRFRRRPGFRGISWPAMVLALGAVAALVVVFLADPSWRGLATRIYDVVWTVWLLVVAARLRTVATGGPALVTAPHPAAVHRAAA